MDSHGESMSSLIQLLLTQRWGLVLGCCLGIIVFIVLFGVLGWMKVKKQRLLEETKGATPNSMDFVAYDDSCFTPQVKIDVGHTSRNPRLKQCRKNWATFDAPLLTGHEDDDCDENKSGCRVVVGAKLQHSQSVDVQHELSRICR